MNPSASEFQSTSWRSSTQQQGSSNNRRGGSIWSTGEYKPLSESRRRPSPRRGSKSPSPPPHSHSQSSSGSGPCSWTTPERRQKLHQRSVPLPTPSLSYLSATSTSTTSSNPTSEEQEEPPILVLDLNHTLLCRSERNRQGSKIPLVRPYLSTFLEYITSPSFTTTTTTTTTTTKNRKREQQRFLPIIFSSARFKNVLSLLSALNLIPPHKLPPTTPPSSSSSSFSSSKNDPRVVKGPFSEIYICDQREGDVLRLIWTRENMGLNEKDFRGDVETTKNLEGVWKALKLGKTSPLSLSPREGEGLLEEEEEEKKRNLEGAKRTILLDDEISKAAQQPFSLLPIKPFILTRKDFPILPTHQPKYPNDPPPLPFAVELPTNDHPAWKDRALLKTIFELEFIKKHWNNKNIGLEIRDGGIEKMREEIRKELSEKKDRGGGEEEEIGEKEIEEEMEKRGEEICRQAGIVVRREWDKEWRERVLEKFK
ncbi:hypothetical protein JCM3765_007013 [Sporobolomyces pararoseus]